MIYASLRENHFDSCLENIKIFTSYGQCHNATHRKFCILIRLLHIVMLCWVQANGLPHRKCRWYTPSHTRKWHQKWKRL